MDGDTHNKQIKVTKSKTENFNPTKKSKKKVARKKHTTKDGLIEYFISNPGEVEDVVYAGDIDVLGINTDEDEELTPTNYTFDTPSISVEEAKANLLLNKPKRVARRIDTHTAGLPPSKKTKSETAKYPSRKQIKKIAKNIVDQAKHEENLNKARKKAVAIVHHTLGREYKNTMNDLTQPELKKFNTFDDVVARAEELRQLRIDAFFEGTQSYYLTGKKLPLYQQYKLQGELNKYAELYQDGYYKTYKRRLNNWYNKLKLQVNNKKNNTLKFFKVDKLAVHLKQLWKKPQNKRKINIF